VANASISRNAMAPLREMLQAIPGSRATPASNLPDLRHVVPAYPDRRTVLLEPLPPEASSLAPRKGGGMTIVRRHSGLGPVRPRAFLISLVFGGLLAFFVGMILAMAQIRHIVRGEVQAIIDEEVTKVE
jgi:hypothetical protein